MGRSFQDLRDPEIDGVPESVFRSKAGASKGVTLILAGVAILCSILGGIQTYFFLGEFGRGSKSYSNARAERPLVGAKIDLERFEKIRVGMKYRDVERLIGGPPGFYETLAGFRFKVRPRIHGKGKDDGLRWYGRTGCITILLDESDSVIDMEYCPGTRFEH